MRTNKFPLSRFRVELANALIASQPASSSNWIHLPQQPVRQASWLQNHCSMWEKLSFWKGLVNQPTPKRKFQNRPSNQVTSPTTPQKTRVGWSFFFREDTYTYELLWSEILVWTEKSDFSSSQLKFQTAGEISNSGENSKQLEIIKKKPRARFFAPGKNLSIRSIFKTEVIRTKIVDWGFPRYT